MKRIRKWGLPVTLGLAIVLTSINFIACVAEEPVGDGSLCTNCNTNADCKDGMKCKFFYSNNAYSQKAANLCAYDYTTSCKTSGY
jgi:hypothetical protein